MSLRKSALTVHPLSDSCLSSFCDRHCCARSPLRHHRRHGLLAVSLTSPVYLVTSLILNSTGYFRTVYNSVLSIVLISIWPIVLGLVSLVYSTLTIRAFLLQRRAFKAIVGRHATTLNLSRYFRLMALAATDISLSVPFSIYILYSDVRRGLLPWTSWSDVHWGFSRIRLAPAWAIKESGGWPAFEVNRWSSPMLAVIFFIFFGLAGESLAAYKRIFARITKPLQTSWGHLAARLTFLRQFKSSGNRKFDGGVTLPSTPGVGSAGWQSETKSRFTEPPTPVSALKASRPFARRESDLESGLDYYFEDRIEGDGEKVGGATEGFTFTPPSLPPRALSTSSLRGNELPPEPPSPPVFDIRRFSSSSFIVNELPPSDLPSAADSNAFPLDLSAFPFPSASLLTPQALSAQFRNSMPTSYSFAPPTASLSDERQFTMTSPPPGLADTRFSEMFRHSSAGVMSPSQREISDSPLSSETGTCHALFPAEPN